MIATWTPDLSLATIHFATEAALARPSADADDALVAAARGGDQDAFTELVRRHQRRVFQLASRLLRRREDVEDAAQETFLTAWAKLGSFRGDAPFEHWLTRVCLNTCYARLRRGESGDLGEAELELAAPARDPDARLDAERLLARLPAADRFVLRLLDGEGWSVAEIASRLGWSRVNVKVRAHRARHRLRRLVEQGLVGEAS